MNRREIFNRVSAHLLKQNAKAVDEYGSCCFLTTDGLRCAIGCLIPDGHTALSDDCGLVDIFEYHPDIVSLWGVSDSGNDMMFLCALMYVHDSCAPENWASELSRVEEAYV